MTEDELRKLRGHQRALEGQLEALSDKHVTEAQLVTGGTYRLFMDEVQRTKATFQELMPMCREEDFFAHRGGNSGESYYHVTPMRQYLAMAVGKVKAAVEEAGRPASQAQVSPDPRTVRVLYEQLHVLRAQVEGLKPEDADKPGTPGSGITVLIPQFNSFLQRVRTNLSAEPALLESVAEVQPVKQFEERIRSARHKLAKQELLLGVNMLLQALGPLLVEVAGASPAITVEREGLFVAGQHFDALHLARQVLSRANQSIAIIDAYIDHKLLQLLATKRDAVSVRILTGTRSLPPDIPALAAAFNKQYGKNGAVSVRLSDVFHDRFLVIDESDYYHFGASLKDAGNRGFMFSRIEEPRVIETLRKSLEDAWQRGEVVV